MQTSKIISAAIQTKHGLRFNPDSVFIRNLEAELERKEAIPADIEERETPEAIAVLIDETFVGDRATLLGKMNWRGILTVQTAVGVMTFRYENYGEWEQAVNAAAIAKLMLGAPAEPAPPAPQAPATSPAPPAPATSPASDSVQFQPARLVCQYSEKSGKYWRLYGADFYKDYGAPIYPEVLSTVLPDHESKVAGFVMKFDTTWKAIAQIAIKDGKKKVQRVLKLWQE